jgi:threonine/homoserine/homoserine lactone efflux protein
MTFVTSIVVRISITCYTHNVPEATLFAIFSTSFLIGLTGAVQPGPLFALTLSETTQRGFWAAPLLIFGHGILEVALVIALTLIVGLSGFLTQELTLNVIGIVGGLVLIVIGIYTTIQARKRMSLHSIDQKKPSRRGMLLFSGAAISLANPYWYVWWATVGLGYLIFSSQKFGAIGIATFFTGHFLADLGWYSLTAFALVKGKKWISDAVYHWLIIVCGISLIGLGIFFVAFVASGGSFITE